MSASTTDKITDTRFGARPNSARATGTRATGGTSLNCDNLSGWPDSTKSLVYFVTYKINSAGAVVAGTQLDCHGIVTGNTINNIVVDDGTDTGNSVGDVVEMLPTAGWGQALSDALTKEHLRTGQHHGVNNTGGMTTDTLTVTGNEQVGGTLGVTGSTTLGGSTTLQGAVGGAGYDLKTIANSYKFFIYLNATTTQSGSFTSVPFDTKVFDTGSNVDIVTHKGRFTAPVTGFYFFIGCANVTTRTGTGYASCITKNGSLTGGLIGNSYIAGTTNAFGSGMSTSGILSLTAGDYVEFQWVGSALDNFNSGNQDQTYFQGFLISAT